MHKDIEVSELLQSASDVWKFLKKQGGLDTNLYDDDLEEELRIRLEISNQSSFEDDLENKSTEDFIVAFFQTVQPYAEMMTDLLCMFEKAGAKQTNKNIAISFDFGQDIPDLKFDLSYFRQCVETWKRVSGIYLANKWDSDTIWSLNRVLRENNENTRNPNLKKWLDQYLKEKIWPDIQLPSPCSGNLDLDKTLAKVWRVWNEVVAESSKYGKERNILRDIWFRRQDNLSEIEQEILQDEQDRWSAKFLAQIDSDHWSASLANGAYLKVERISKLDPQIKLHEATRLREELENVFIQISKVEIEGETLVQELQDFLQLPLWKYRYELYSVWIATQILDSLETYSIRIHQADGTLKFSFSGTHFATVDDFEPRLHIWTELRSPLKNPIGRGRSKSIQPDYSLVIDPITSPESSLLVVECKQYSKASAKNFSSALSDYARGRPNAHVIIVNYGSANQNILDKVDPEVRNRTHLIGMMRPNSIASQTEFKKLIKGALLQSATSSKDQSVFNSLIKGGRATLTWGDTPQDLDLHLRVEAITDTYSICYSNKGSIITKPWATLHEDIRSGNGFEIIKIAKWVEGKYYFAVHNYSGDASLSTCHVTFTITNGEQELQFKCPSCGEGKWWSVLIIDTSINQWEVINKIVESPW